MQRFLATRLTPFGSSQREESFGGGLGMRGDRMMRTEAQIGIRLMFGRKKGPPEMSLGRRSW